MIRELFCRIKARGSSYLVVMLIVAMAGAAIAYFAAKNIKNQASNVTSNTGTILQGAQGLQN